MSERIVYPKREPITISGGGEVTAHSGPSVTHARRFSLDVAEDALQRIGTNVIPHIVERLARQIAHEQRGAVEETVHAYLRDRAWAEPIIRDALRDAVREYVRGIFDDHLRGSPSGEGSRHGGDSL